MEDAIDADGHGNRTAPSLSFWYIPFRKLALFTPVVAYFASGLVNSSDRSNLPRTFVKLTRRKGVAGGAMGAGPRDLSSMQDHGTKGPGGDVLVLPWHATGRLSPSHGRRIDAALRRDGALAGTFAEICREQAAIMGLNEDLGTPSPRALLALFAAIDAEPRNCKPAGRPTGKISP